jgi:hypothetical protein
MCSSAEQHPRDRLLRARQGSRHADRVEPAGAADVDRSKSALVDNFAGQWLYLRT